MILSAARQPCVWNKTQVCMLRPSATQGEGQPGSFPSLQRTAPHFAVSCVEASGQVSFEERVHQLVDEGSDNFSNGKCLNVSGPLTLFCYSVCLFGH